MTRGHCAQAPWWPARQSLASGISVESAHVDHVDGLTKSSGIVASECFAMRTPRAGGLHSRALSFLQFASSTCSNVVTFARKPTARDALCADAINDALTEPSSA
jgi:hypothetical protein